jgi:putative DNA primase/helicase
MTIEQDKFRDTLDQHDQHAKAAYWYQEWFRERIAWFDGLGWHRFNGTHWVADNAEPKKAGLELAKVLRNKDYDSCKLLNNAHGLNGVLDIAKALMTVPADKLDANPYLLNMPSGTLDLETMKVRDHNPADYITRSTLGSYNPDIKPEQMAVTAKFVREVIPDDETRRYVCQLFGLALYGGIIERILPLCYGAGFNGKSTLLEAMLSAFGSYGVKISSNTLIAHRGDRHTTELTDLRGARLAVASETDAGQQMNAALIKDLTTAGRMSARKIRQDNISWPKSHTVMMDTNHLPKVDGTDKAIMDRVRVISFDEDFTDRKDAKLPDKLAGEADAFITWAVRGWQDYQENGLQEPYSVLVATDSYKSDHDTLGMWLGECTQRCSSESVGRTELHSSYKWFCQGHDIEPLNATDFYVALERAGFKPTKYAGTRVHKGLRILKSVP